MIKKLKGLIIVLFMSLSLFGLACCNEACDSYTFEQISVAQAKKIMDTQSGYIILDVRTQEEFAQGHIENAINLDYEKAEQKASEFLPDKNQLILIYCRSGRRSKIAAETLVKLGYTNIKEFGGIIDWPYEIVK